jgi:integrase
LTHEEAIRLLDACRAQKNPALVDLVELALYTGMRQGELLNLAWGDVDRARGVLLLEVTKSGRRREVPLNGPAYAVLERRSAAVETAGLVLGNRSWDSYRKGWETAVEAAKLDAPLRHTFASWAVQRGVTLVELKDLLGHSTLTMVLRYAHLAPENLRAAVARLDGVLVPAPASSGARRAQEAQPLVLSEA